MFFTLSSHKRDEFDNCVWTWSHGDQKQWGDWRTIEQLDNVELDQNRNLLISNMGLKDNRIYGLLRQGYRTLCHQFVLFVKLSFFRHKIG